ncbi:hypothetical protein TK90_2693 (plasmid) [Thioalkalivibrio sp. K90mix]|uniref:hypothetical protein n=1 Tax=Thioalkalivibrio sp. (strain K90mix) TaxID=396595 RepID=UPI000195A446|nr:hypothetical protein [Thioalkalivibrio sp. K90mix]ADC73179.1 hypothetical protein TK90_2693 [Thioalkalivibrio sp. K90mix]
MQIQNRTITGRSIQCARDGQPAVLLRIERLELEGGHLRAQAVWADSLTPAPGGAVVLDAAAAQELPADPEQQAIDLLRRLGWVPSGKMPGPQSWTDAHDPMGF